MRWANQKTNYLEKKSRYNSPQIPDFSNHFKREGLHLNHTRRFTSWSLLVTVLLMGCAEGSGLSERETGALLGSGMGAGLGAIIGNQTGHAGAGTAIGAGAGLLAGALAGEANRRSKENAKKEIRQ